MNFINHRRFAATLCVVSIIFVIHTGGLAFLALSTSQEITFGIAIIATLLWITAWVPLFVVSFLILALELLWLLPSLNLDANAQDSAIFFAPFFSDIVLLFLGGFVISSLMQKYALDQRFAQMILKKTRGVPSTTLLGIIIICAVLSMWISNTATAAMMLTMVFPILKRLPQNHSFKKALVLAIPFSCNLGGMGTPIGTPPNAIALSYLAKHNMVMSFGQWMLLTTPFMVILLLFLWRILLWFFPAGELRLHIPQRPSGSLSPRHYAALLVFILTACGWFFSASLGITTGTVALMPIIVSFWLGLLDIDDFRALPWDVLYMVCGGLALGLAFKLSGLGALIITALPLEGTSSFLFLAFSASALVMSTLMSNTATAGLIIPLVMNLHFADQQMLSLVISLALMCSMAMALPVSTPPNAIAFSSRSIGSADMLHLGAIVSVLGFVLVGLCGPAYWLLFI